MSERKRFEVWAKGYNLAFKGGRYVDKVVNKQWSAWQAAQRIDVTPTMVEAAEETYMPFGDMQAAIEAALAHQ